MAPLFEILDAALVVTLGEEPLIEIVKALVIVTLALSVAWKVTETGASGGCRRAGDDTRGAK